MADDTRGEAGENELSIERWREELQAFGRQTSSQLQQIVGSLDAAARQARSAPPSPPPVEVRPVVPTMRRAATEADPSEDRLANLKRMLAAKLSNSDGPSDGGGSPGS